LTAIAPTQVVGEVVLTLAGATSGGAAARWASEEALARGLGLVAVHTWSSDVVLSVDLPAGLLPGVRGPLTARLVSGPVVPELLALSPSVLVVGSALGSGRSGSAVARRLRRLANCPVVVFPDVTGGSTDQPDDVLRSLRSTRDRVVVGVCGSEASRAALAWAACEARLRGLLLVLVYVQQPPLRRSWRYVIHPGRFRAEQQMSAVRQLASWAMASLSPEQLASAELVASGNGPRLEALVEASQDAELLVVGRGVHSLFDRVLRGRVVSDLSRLVWCPVVSVPAGPPVLPKGAGVV
jgi:nucleotide-binding universal stress UspA family protein